MIKRKLKQNKSYVKQKGNENWDVNTRKED